MDSFDELQRRLGDVLEMNRAGSSAEHVVVVLPSHSFGESLLSHYADRLPALEHRYLLALFVLAHIESCEMVFVSSVAPEPEVLEYYASFLPAERRSGIQHRFRVVTVPDASPRSVASKLLDRPDLLDDLRRSFAGRPAFIEPWNVTDHEVEVARRLGAPINGTSPELWPLGFKSAGRRLFAASGTPLPVGVEDVRTVDDVIEAIDAIQSARPQVSGVVIKTDDSGAGDGNVVLRLRHRAWGADALRRQLEGLPPWYLEELRHGGVVEELVVGDQLSSPSVQVDIGPGGSVTALATHEQVLGGVDHQVYTGCRFPADPAYAAELAHHGCVVGRRLAELGAVGRSSIDFITARSAGQWDIKALEVNLRKGGTTHPYATLRNLVPGRYEPDPGRWVTLDGSTRCYRSSDNVVGEARLGRPASEVIKAVEGAGLQFDVGTGTGVVLHMLSCLAIDGRFGMTAIGTSSAHAEELYQAADLAV